MSEANALGKIITFYSYKGGTGRSMALANVAWILASNGRRVLTVDWDLEAPGLHRYFKPFLLDHDLTSSDGVIDCVIDYAVKALTPAEDGKELPKDWYVEHANILRYATSVKWRFPDQGRLDFIPAGRQGPSYGTRMNSFDWRNFYDRLGGGAFLEAVRERMRKEYDFTLIDSRTGVSDTSGICTVQMPDDLVVCFTLNDQGIEGAAAVAASVHEYHRRDGLRIFPVPMRIEFAEKQKLEIRKEYARSKFDSFLEHIPVSMREQYWEDIQFSYIPYYAYEEILAAFGDKPRQKNTVLASAESLTSYITQGAVDRLGALQETQRLEVLSQYEMSPVALNAGESHDTLPIRSTEESKYEISYLYDLFLSYSHADEVWVNKLAARLENEYWQGRRLKIFLPYLDIRPGQSIAKRMEEGVGRSRLLGLVLSPQFISGQSFLDFERLITTYVTISEREERLIPLYLRTCEIPTLLRPLLYIDFRDDSQFEERYQTLLSVIKNEPLPKTVAPSESRTTFPLSAIPRPPIIGFVARRDRDGRDIVERLKKELAPQNNGVVALWGAGGVGKTTLAAEASRALANDYKHRVIWISADARIGLPFTSILDEIATQLGNEGARKLMHEQKKELARTLLAAAPTLIVLDNFETITADVQAECLDFLSFILGCSTLITTRQKVENARSIPIASMSFEEANEFFQRLAAQSQDPDIYVGLDVPRLIETAEANPLVIEWIIGQLELANDFKEVLDELTQGQGEAAQRVFDRSYNLPQLDNGGRAVLLALSLFVPSASRAALAAVANLDLSKKRDKERFKRAYQTLASLWLIKRTDAGQRLAVAGLTRELTRARLSRDPRVTAYRQRFIARFLRLAEANSYPTAEHLNAVETEKDNILTAIDLALEVQDWRSVIHISHALHDFLRVRGYWDEALRRSQQAAEAARALRDEHVSAHFAGNAASIRLMRGEYDAARRTYEQILGVSKAQKNDANIATSLHQLGVIAQEQGEWAEARRLYGESLGIYRQLGDRIGIASTLHRLGTVASDIGNLVEARDILNESLAIEKETGNVGGVAATLHSIGKVARLQGDLTQARKLFSESIDIGKKLGDQNLIATTLYELGIVAEEEGNRREAAQLFRESLSIFERLKSPQSVQVHQHLAKVEENL